MSLIESSDLLRCVFKANCDSPFCGDALRCAAQTFSAEACSSALVPLQRNFDKSVTTDVRESR